MTKPPDQPKIYHILHVDRLPAVIAEGALLSESEVLRRGLAGTVVGMSEIKARRRTIEVSCCPDRNVGDFVPFYFCSRSVMLYVLHMANSPGLEYRGGQGPIIHLEADLRTAVDLADGEGRAWAFSRSNAGSFYAEFKNDMAELDSINWAAVAARNFRSGDVAHDKQAEFLMDSQFNWGLISRIGVHSQAVYDQVRMILQDAAHQPKVEIKPDWYY